MQVAERLSLEQIRAFLEASDEVGFKGRNREEVYGFVSETLRQQRYHELKRRSRTGATLPGEDDRVKSSADHSSDLDVLGRRSGTAQGL